MKTNWLLFVVALAIASNAMASNWISVVHGSDSDVYFDLQGLIMNGDQRTFWVKYVYKHSQKLGDSKKTYFVEISYEGLNCTSRTDAVYKQLFYDKTGNVIYQTEYDSNPSWEPIVPDSNGEMTADETCAIKPNTGNSPTGESQPASSPPEQVTPPISH